MAFYRINMIDECHEYNILFLNAIEKQITRLRNPKFRHGQIKLENMFNNWLSIITKITINVMSLNSPSQHKIHKKKKNTRTCLQQHQQREQSIRVDATLVEVRKSQPKLSLKINLKCLKTLSKVFRDNFMVLSFHHSKNALNILAFSTW